MAIIKGKWEWNFPIRPIDGWTSEDIFIFDIDFISNGESYKSIKVHVNATWGINLWYDTTQIQEVSIYEDNGQWKNDYSFDRTYAIIDFGDVEQTVDESFYAWLISNATEVINLSSMTLLADVEIKGDLTLDSNVDIHGQLSLNGKALTDDIIKLSSDMWTDKTIGYIEGTASSPKKVANAGDTLKTMFTNIFGTIEDDTSNLVTNPYINSVSIGNSSYEYGTKLDEVSVTITPKAGSYKYGPAVEGAGWSGTYTLSGDGFTPKNDDTSNTQTISLSSTFTVGTSSALTLNVSRAYRAAANTAISKMGAATTQQIEEGTATKSGTFNPTAQKYVYYAVTSDTTTPADWTKYSSGQTSVTDLSITADAGKYVWIASTGSYSSIYAFNEVSGKYNTDKTPTTKITNQTITNSQSAEASGYILYRTTNAKAQSGTVKYKLA